MLENVSEGEFSDDYDELVERSGDGDIDSDDGDKELIFGEDKEDLSDISLIITFWKEPEKKKRKWCYEQYLENLSVRCLMTVVIVRSSSS